MVFIKIHYFYKSIFPKTVLPIYDVILRLDFASFENRYLKVKTLLLSKRSN